MNIEVEIRTITSTWITYVDEQEFKDREPGAISGNLDRIKAGEPIEVREESSGGRPQLSRLQMAVFNPGHVVAVIEGLGGPLDGADRAATARRR